MIYNSMRKEKNLMIHRVCTTKRPSEIWQHLKHFWIKKNYILRLFVCLQRSASTTCCQKSRCHRIVTLCILLKKRLYYPYRCKDMVPLFLQNPIELYLIFSLYFIYQRHHHRQQSWYLYFLQPPYLQSYADAVAGKFAPLYTLSKYWEIF